MKSTRTILFMVFALPGLISCAANPATEYQASLKYRESSAASDISAVAKSATAHTLIEGDRKKFAIDHADAVITLDGLASFYEVFRIKGASGKPLAVTTYSFVKGGGFSPYVVWPRVFFIDNKGSVIEASPADGRVSTSLMGFGVQQWECNWTISASTDGDYLVLVTSDNRVINQQMASDTTMLAAGTFFFPWTFGYKAHTTGDMAIRWRKDAPGDYDKPRSASDNY